MKEMIYIPNEEIEILDDGAYRGYNYVIISYGFWPCCYVQIPETSLLYSQNHKEIDFNGLMCHGGITYNEEYLMIDKNTRREGWWIGWDYAYFTDYNGMIENFKTLKMKTASVQHTTCEMKDECISVIDQLAEIYKPQQ